MRTQVFGKNVLLALIATLGLTTTSARAQDAANAPPIVRTMIIEQSPLTISRHFFGRVRARETVDLAFEIGGRLALLVPEEGARIAKGDQIAALERDGLERAVARAELQRDMAARDAERARVLAESATGAATRAEDSETARDLAEIALRDARAALADATLTAPFDALVAARLTPPQSMVELGQPVLRLHDMSEVRVEIDLPERIFVEAGGLVRVAFKALGPAGTETPLRLVSFQPDTSRIGQTYLVTLAFLDPPPALLPGASVTIIATFPNPASGITVPVTAVIAGNDGSASVLVLEAQGESTTVRRVQVGIASSGGTTFTIEGLERGAEIVAVGAHRLADGQTVRRFTGLQIIDDERAQHQEIAP